MFGDSNEATSIQGTLLTGCCGGGCYLIRGVGGEGCKVVPLLCFPENKT